MNQKYVFEGKFGIERETLRLDKSGRLSQSSHPFDDPHLERDFCENQLEIITGVNDSVKDAIAELAYWDRLAKEKLSQRSETLHIYSNPPYFQNADEIPVAYSGMETSKFNYRKQLEQKYGKPLMLYSGIHFNFSFAEDVGDTVNFRTSKVSYKLRKKIKNSKDKLRIFSDTYEPIISREQFDEAQKRLNDRKRRVPTTIVRSPYYELLFCGACNHSMRLNRYNVVSKKKGVYTRTTYICSLATKKRGACTSHLIHECVLDVLVIEQINKLLAFAKSDRKGFDKMLRERCAGNALAELTANNEEIKRIKDRIAEIDRFIQGLFESKVKGEIDGEMFCTLSEKYRNEKAELKSKIEILIEKQTTLKDEADRGVKLGTSVNKYDTISEVTSEILKDFVERIEIGDLTEEKIDGKKVRKIRIFFIGIGEFYME